MRATRIQTLFGLWSAIVCFLIPSSLSADAVKITVQSLQPNGGFAFSPIWFGFHDGSFQPFTAGSSASSSIEAVAELADLGQISNQFSGQGVQTSVGGSPFTPGSSASTIVNIADPSMDRFVNYAGMVVPSNDFFLGNQSGLALFDANGNFLGPQTITIFGRNVWDAGTEVNDVTNHPAFIQGQDPHGGADEHGTIGLFLDRPDSAAYLASILGKTTSANYEITSLLSSDVAIASISFQVVPEVPSMTMSALPVLGLCCFWIYRRKEKQNQVSNLDLIHAQGDVLNER